MTTIAGGVFAVCETFTVGETFIAGGASIVDGLFRAGRRRR